MLWVMLMLAAQAGAPADGTEDPLHFRPATDPGSWVTTDDYPITALRDTHEGTTGFRLTVGPDGLPRRCEVTASSGHAELDDATCRLVMQRARFETQRDDKGVRVGGTYANRIRWQIPDDYLERLAQSGFRVDQTRRGLPRAPLPDPAMVTLDAAAHYPPAALAARQEGDVGMMLSLDAAGKVIRCVVTESSMVRDLDTAACALMRSDGRFEPALDSAGTPVKSEVPAVFSWVLPRTAGATAEPAHRKFPLSSPMAATMTIVVGADGIARDCKFSATGLPVGLPLEGNPCDMFGGSVRYIPFVDAAGKPVTRRVTMRAETIVEPEPGRGSSVKP